MDPAAYESPARLAERARDAWAVLRCVPAIDGEDALRRHGHEHDPQRFTGTRDGLDEDMLQIARLLNPEKPEHTLVKLSDVIYLLTHSGYNDAAALIEGLIP